MRKPDAGGGLPAILYVLRKSRQMGGLRRTWRTLRSKNACKTCAVGMGGQQGGMVNERGKFPEICKKSLQAMAADMQGAIGDTFWTSYSLPQLRTFTPRELEHCGRLVQPVLCDQPSGHYRVISWDAAFQRIAARLTSITADQSFWYFSGRSSNEAGFLLQLFARLYGTNNVNNCSYYCHQASGVGLHSSIGTGTATVTLEDLEGSDLVFVIGGNPASNHPRLMTTLLHLRRRKGHVIAINPLVETGLVRFRVPSDPRSLLFGSEIASLYVQPHIGGDLALLTGVAKRIVELEAHDETFLNTHCTGWDAWRDRLQATDWTEICGKSGVGREDIDRIAEHYARAERVVFAWTMGITHHVHGVQNVQAIANLALLRGMVGKPNAGLIPIRGHSNVQGIGTMGVAPQLSDAVFARLQNELGVQLPRTRGLDTLECIEQAHAGRLKVGFCLGGNLYGSNPDATFAAEALSKLDLLVYASTTLNTGHAHGLARETVILPVLARDEEPEPTTQESMFNFVRLSEGGPARHMGPRSEVAVIAEMGERVLGPTAPIDWTVMRHTGHIREAIAKVVPGMEALRDIDRTRREFQIHGRTFHEPRFRTSDARAVLHAHALPELAGGPGQLRLMTIRSEGQFNTVVYEEEDAYRGQNRRDIILMHPDDMMQRDLRHDQRVTVRSAAGRMNDILVRAYPAIRAGNVAMYCPEANVLVPRHADALSRTPSFKSVIVTVHPESNPPDTAATATTTDSSSSRTG